MKSLLNVVIVINHFLEDITSVHMHVFIPMESLLNVYCIKLLSQKTDLSKHSHIHSNEKPFKCNICNKSFSQKHHLNIYVFTTMKNLLNVIFAIGLFVGNPLSLNIYVFTAISDSFC